MNNMPHFHPRTPSPRRFLARNIPSVTPVVAVAAALMALAAPAMAAGSDAAALPEAPQAQTTAAPGLTGPGRDNTFFGLHLGPAYPLEAGKWDTIINPGTHTQPFTATDKLLYAGHEQIAPIVLIPALFSAGYGQVTDANPHYGVDAGGFGERFGAAMLRQATDRISGDGLLAAAFRQDPRYYRNDGTIMHRSLLSMRQTFLRRNDHGGERVNISGIGGHVVSNFLAMTYYPHNSATASIAAQGFGTSMLADVGGKLFFEFAPDLLRLALHRNP